MVDLFAALIINKRKTISEVPLNLKASVIARLKELGYDENGDPIETTSSEEES